MGRETPCGGGEDSSPRKEEVEDSAAPGSEVSCYSSTSSSALSSHLQWAFFTGSLFFHISSHIIGALRALVVFQLCGHSVRCEDVSLFVAVRPCVE